MAMDIIPRRVYNIPDKNERKCIMVDFSKFDANLSAIKAELEKATPSQSQSFQTIPDGTYDVTVEKMELGETGPNSKTPGAPKMFVQFRIQIGQYANECIYWHQVLTHPFQIKLALDFMQSLQTGVLVTFESYAKLAELMKSVGEQASIRRYVLSYATNNRGYHTYAVTPGFSAAQREMQEQLLYPQHAPQPQQVPAQTPYQYNAPAGAPAPAYPQQNGYPGIVTG